MRINFLQGIAQYPTDGNTQAFLAKAGSYVNLVAVNGNTDIIFTNGINNYLHTESVSVNQAWGPFDDGVDYWIYWDINPRSAVRTFGSTLVAPLYGPTTPTSPVNNQHFFNTTSKKMYVFENNMWLEKLRVFAAKINSAVFTPLGAQLIMSSDPLGAPVPNMKPFGNTQVGIQTPDQLAGRMVVDSVGLPIKKQNGAFFTTEDDFFINGSPTTAVRLESNILYATATENIAKYQVVAFVGFGQIALANYNQVYDTVLAISMEDILKDEVGTLCVQGKITNPDWNYTNFGASLWVHETGLFSETDPRIIDPVHYQLIKPPIARVLDPQTIIFNQGLGVDDVVAGNGAQGPVGPMGPQGPQGPIGPTPVIDYDYIINEVMLRMQRTLTSIQILGATSVVERATSTFTVTATYSDNTTQPNATPIIWSCDPAIGTINSSGIFTAASINVDTNGLISASYTEGSVTVTDTHAITVLAIAAPQSIAISGAISVNEGTSSTYSALVTLVNASTVNNPSGLIWSCDTAIGTINSSGVFTATSVNADTNGLISVSYTLEGVTVTDTHAITVINRVLTSITIIGTPTTMNEGATATYTVNATFNFGPSQTNVTPVTWGSDVNIGTITSGGVFTAAQVASNQTGNISASYTFEGITQNDTQAITVNNVAAFAVFYGTAPLPANQAAKNAALVLGLTRVNQADFVGNNYAFTAGAGISTFFAYPVSLGLAKFENHALLGFYGGWDAATGDPVFDNASGPLTLSVTVDGTPTSYYLYQSDAPGTGNTVWNVLHA